MSILKDTYGRHHSYLRISVTERCNLRCTYCMPAEGIQLSPKSHLMTADEIFKIAQAFVKQGVSKIRLTGGEPLVRKDIDAIITRLSSLPVTLSITTNAISTHRHIETFKKARIKQVNVSLDSLQTSRFTTLTRRNYLETVQNNINELITEGFEVKLNCVLIKGINDDEITSFIKLSKDKPLHIRFIEFMPFDGNKWNIDKMVSYKEIMNTVNTDFPKTDILRINDNPNDTAKNYQIKGYQGTFAVISSVTNPFCSTCNRIRLTANGKLKNCLFSSNETDLLTPLRQGDSILPYIEKAVVTKYKIRSGMESIEQFKDPDLHGKNRSMIAIGG
ncbi:MAG: GTP 3',8-cyclase MoaA [Kordia sp.]|nr:MAG: GTP 3',8-cyclase MoaA [Kordia sp.]